MQLNIQRADLSRVLTNVGRVVEARNTIPILSQVLLMAENDTLRVAGTDLDILATDTSPASIDAPGAICVNAKMLADIAKKAGGADISLSSDKGQMIVKSGRSKFTLPTLPATDFPEMRTSAYADEFEIDLAALFGPVSFAISTEETRYYLNGVFFKGGASVAVSTDGHRLARNRGPDLPEFAGVIVPRKTVGMLPKGAVKVAVSDTLISVTSGDFSLVSKLIDGTFPDYERVIPKNNEQLVTVDRDAMMRAAERVSTVSNERGRAVRLSIAPGSIALSSRNPDAEASDEIEADYAGEPFDIGFNGQYLREILGVLPGGPVRFALAGPGSPAVVTGGAEGWDGILMPTRV